MFRSSHLMKKKPPGKEIQSFAQNQTLVSIYILHSLIMSKIFIVYRCHLNREFLFKFGEYVAVLCISILKQYCNIREK